MKNFFLLSFLLFFSKSFSQFSNEIIISTQENNPRSVFAADLDGDNDLDVLVGSEFGPNLTWFQNLGGGNFSEQKIIPTPIDFIKNVYAADLDEDNDLDIIPAHNNNVSWYENLGDGNFSEQKIIDGQALEKIIASDLNGDNKIDILFASHFQENKVGWYENLGGGNFSEQKVISLNTPFPSSIYAADLDNDNDLDVITSAQGPGDMDGEIAWYENNGGGNFSGKNIISNQSFDFWDIYVSDLDNDNYKDIIYIAFDKIAWYKNMADGSFSNEVFITNNAQWLQSIRTADFDKDGDQDIVSATLFDDKIAWFENLGDGSFSEEKIISTKADRARSVYIADIDEDGKLDILSASTNDNKIAWYKNLFGTTSSIDNQIKESSVEIHPNPFGEFLNIKQESLWLGYLTQLSIYDVAGQLIQSTILSDATQQISTVHLANGLYFYQVINADGQMVANGKVVKH